MRVAVLADTHVPKRARTLPEPAWQIVRSCDVILHAGDVVSPAFLEELKLCGPLYAVRGNNDLELHDLPETLEFELAGARIAMIHDSGDKKGRESRMKRRFPSASVVVFGHSHVPVRSITDGQLLFNPGSATDRRSQPVCTMGVLEIAGGSVEAQLIQLP